MSLAAFFFSFGGRFNRARYWLAILGYIAIRLLTVALVAIIVSPPGELLYVSTDALGFFRGVEFGGALAFASIVVTLLDLATFVSQLAVFAKRLHDRNKSGWWVLLYVFGPAVLLFLGFPEVPNPAQSAIAVVGVVVAIWAFVELGFFRGTSGPNRYGPDPLQPWQTEPSWPDLGPPPDVPPPDDARPTGPWTSGR